MAIGRNISAAVLDTMPVEEIVEELQPQDYRSFQIEIEEAEALWKKRKETLQIALDNRYGEPAATSRLAQHKDTGTVHLPDGDYSVACELKKKVEWDTDKLTQIRKRIIEANEDPSVYMKLTLTVPEAVFANFSPKVQEAFTDARTVKPEKPKYVVTHKDDKKAKR